MSRRSPREIDVSISDLEEGGLGGATFEDHPVWARNALPGECVTVRVLKRRAGAWYGEADTPVLAARSRQSPACAAYPRCGGCVLQHVDYSCQLEHKQAVLRKALDAHDVQPVRWRTPVCGPQFHYRHRARLGARVVGGRLLVGFREGFSNRVARMSDCKVLALPFSRMLPDLQQTLGQLAEPDRIPQVELTGGDRDFAVVVRHLSHLDVRDRELLTAFSRRSGMRVFLQPGGYDTVAALEGTGPDELCFANPDFGLCFHFRPTDFIQVNPYVNRALVRAVVLALAPRPGASALDLFCGIGNFSLALARRGIRVHGLENASGAVLRARHNAGVNGLSSWAEFAAADLYDSRCPELPESEYMLLDPPRSGAGPNLRRWVDRPGLRRIAYVSCNPRSFASDAAVLAEQGYQLEEAGMFDMFPHTAHIETLGLFIRRRPA